MNPDEFLNRLKESEEFKKEKTDPATYLSHYASMAEKLTAVKCVIGDINISTIDPMDIVKGCKEAYGWRLQCIVASHYLAILGTGTQVTPLWRPKSVTQFH